MAVEEEGPHRSDPYQMALTEAAIAETVDFKGPETQTGPHKL